MRPSHRVYCVDCHREKIVFETEKKANNFIKWNADEIEQQSGFRPVRTYYCSCCGGWHTTSRLSIPNIYKTDNLIKGYEKELKSIETYLN